MVSTRSSCPDNRRSVCTEHFFAVFQGAPEGWSSIDVQDGWLTGGKSAVPQPLAQRTFLEDALCVALAQCRVHFMDKRIEAIQEFITRAKKRKEAREEAPEFRKLQTQR